MNNLTRLLNRENKWYKLGPIVIGRGISKKIPLYFGVILAIISICNIIPLTPFWFISQINGGWILNFIVLPFLGAVGLQGIQKAGKTPERYLWSLIRFTYSAKHTKPYQIINQPRVYQFATAYTYRLIPREEDES